MPSDANLFPDRLRNAALKVSDIEHFDFNNVLFGNCFFPNDCRHLCKNVFISQKEGVGHSAAFLSLSGNKLASEGTMKEEQVEEENFSAYLSSPICSSSSSLSSSSDDGEDDSFHFDEFISAKSSLERSFKENEERKREEEEEEGEKSGIRALLEHKRGLEKLKDMYYLQFYRLRDEARRRHRAFVSMRNLELLEKEFPKSEKDRKRKAEEEEEVEESGEEMEIEGDGPLSRSESSLMTSERRSEDVSILSLSSCSPSTSLKAPSTSSLLSPSPFSSSSLSPSIHTSPFHPISASLPLHSLSAPSLPPSILLSSSSLSLVGEEGQREGENEQNKEKKERERKRARRVKMQYWCHRSPYLWVCHKDRCRNGKSHALNHKKASPSDAFLVPCVLPQNSKYFAKQTTSLPSAKKKQVSLSYIPSNVLLFFFLILQHLVFRHTHKYGDL